jgi:hypothetical protein
MRVSFSAPLDPSADDLRIAVPARHRLFVSSWAFLLCLGGLYWTDYLMEKYPPTETELQRIQEAKKEWRNLRIPSISEFQAARAQAEAAQIAGATGKRDK